MKILNTLIVVAPIAESSESLAFRLVTECSRKKLKLGTLIEVEQDEKDECYQKFKDRGILDFIDQFITPEKRELGIRIDLEHNFALTIAVKQISWANFYWIIGQVNSLIAIK